MLSRQPTWWPHLGLLLTLRVRQLFLALEEVSLARPAARLARRLLLIADGYGDWDGRTRRVIEVRQEQLAMMLSMSRQTTNQLLKEIEARGVIRVAYGQIEILDVEALRTAARSGEGEGA